VSARPCRLLALVVGLLAAPLAGSAEEAPAASGDEASTADDPLADLRQQMDQAEFRRAGVTAAALIEGGGLTPPQLAEVYRAQATCYAALRRRDDARDAFVKVLAIDRDYALPKTASPLLRQPFQAAVAAWEGKQRPFLRVAAQERLERGEVLVVEPEFGSGDVPGLVTEITLHLRQPDGSFATYLGVDGRIDIAPGELEGLERVEYYVAGRDPRGNVVIAAGTPNEPLVLEIVEPRVEEAPPPAEPDTPPPRPRRQWHRQWWVWTIVGVVVVGVATGVTLGTVDLDPSTCAQAIGEECDYSARVIP
jgi:hypothetical protein